MTGEKPREVQSGIMIAYETFIADSTSGCSMSYLAKKYEWECHVLHFDMRVDGS